MTKHEAELIVARLSRRGVLINMSVKVVRILPHSADPIVPGDNGWDVEITDHNEEMTVEKI